MGKPCLDALRVLCRRLIDDAVGRPQNHGDAFLSAKHVVYFRHLVEHLVHTYPDKIREMHVRHRTHTGKGCANRCAHN